MGKLALVLVSLAALSATAVACGEEEQAPTVPSQSAGSPQDPTESASPIAISSPVPVSEALPACPTPGPGRTFQYEPITGSETKEHTDGAAGYSVVFPAEWSICQVPFDPQIRDFASAVEFYDNGELLRLSVYVYSNPTNAMLEDWIKDHDAIFFDRPTENRVIGGVQALVAPLNFEGQPAPGAYLQHKGFIVGIQGLTTEDFEAVASKFSVR